MKEHKVVWSYQDNVRAPSSSPLPGAAEGSNADEEGSGTGTGGPNGGSLQWKPYNSTSSNNESNGESSADGAAAPVFESPEVTALAEIGRGKATGDGEFVRNLKLGDIVTVWAKARFPGWVNYVDRVKVDVYWAI